MNSIYNFTTIDAPKVTLKQETEFPFAELCEVPSIVDDETRRELADINLFDMHLPNFAMRISQGKYKHNVLMVNSGNVGLEYLGSCLFLEGNVKTRLRVDTNCMESPVGTQNFKYDPNNEFRHWLPANVPFRIAHFSVSPDHFLQFLPDGESWSENLKTRILRRERILGQRTPAITLAQAQALQLVLNCPLGGKLGQTMIETAIVQIMLLNLHSLFQVEEAQRSDVSQKDRNMANAVKDHIGNTYLADHTLNDLTKHFATNTNKLMSVFKKVFGMSIFEYIGDLRMKHAHDLLAKEDLTVTEVSKLVGYKNPNHFSAAFKKKFGVSPVKVGS
ncbi:MAG: AraC family transcriptional regulator [Bacteroidota bacterium]